MPVFSPLMTHQLLTPCLGRIPCFPPSCCSPVAPPGLSKHASSSSWNICTNISPDGYISLPELLSLPSLGQTWNLGCCIWYLGWCIWCLSFFCECPCICLFECLWQWWRLQYKVWRVNDRRRLVVVHCWELTSVSRASTSCPPSLPPPCQYPTIHSTYSPTNTQVHPTFIHSYE